MKSLIITAALFIGAASHADRIDIIIRHTSNNGNQVFGEVTNSLAAAKANAIIAGANTNLVRIARDARRGVINGEADRLQANLADQYQAAINAAAAARDAAMEAAKSAKQDAE